MADLPVFCVRKPEENYLKVGFYPQKRTKANCYKTSVVRSTDNRRLQKIIWLIRLCQWLMRLSNIRLKNDLGN